MRRIMSFKPGVNRYWLYFIAGVMWTSVGLYLIHLTRDWVRPLPKSATLLIIIAGLILGAVIYTFGFSNFAKRNIHRIDSIDNHKPCLFAFQGWTSYPLVLFMISLGIFLRVYSPVPKSVLAFMYIGIGFSLFLASFHYYKHIWTTNFKQRITDDEVRLPGNTG